MIRISKIRLGYGLFLLMASLLYSQSVFAIYYGDCSVTNYPSKLPWVYQGGDFMGWANNLSNQTEFVIAKQTMQTGVWGGGVLGGVSFGVVCNRYVQSSGNIPLISHTSTVTVNGTKSGSYFTLPGFNQIGFKVDVQWDNGFNMWKLVNGGRVFLDPPPVTTRYPDAAITNQAYFAACSYDSTGSGGMTYCSWGGMFSVNGTDNMAVDNAQYLSTFPTKKWIYTLKAVKLSKTTLPTITGTFPTTALGLPTAYVTAAITRAGAGSDPNKAPQLYCIGCVASKGDPPPIVVPAKCDIPAGNEKRSVNMNPSPVRWGDFAYTTTIAGVSSKVNGTWTPVSISLACDKAATASVTANDAATGTTNTDGKLLNSARTTSNVGIQVFYKTDGSAACSGTPTLSNGSAVPLNRTTQMTISGTSATPVLNFCARYYTTATTEAALDAGTESLPNSFTSTMNYTFTYQ